MKFPSRHTPRLSTGSAPRGSAGPGRRPCPYPVGFADRDLKNVSPLTEQFAPSEDCPIPQRAKMGGMT